MSVTPLSRIVVVSALVVGLLPQVSFGQESADAYLAFLMARRLEAEGNNDGALASLERAAAADPSAAEIYAEMAAFHMRQDQAGPAEQAAKKAIGLDPDSVGGNRALGLIYAERLDGAPGSDAGVQATALRDAIAHLERAIANSPVTTDLLLHYTLGRLYVRNGEPEKGVASLSRMLSQNPGSAQGRLALAEAYAAGGDLPNAISTLREVLESEPRVAVALGQYQEEAGLLAEAAESYTLALSVQPRSRELKLRRIAVLIDAKEYTRAAGFAADARRQHPDDPRFVRLHARALFDSGDEAGAIALLEQTVQASPVDTGMLFTLADVYADAGRGSDAEQMLRRVIGIEPANANALNYLGYLLAVRGSDLDEAIDLVQRALDQDPDNGAYLDSLGWAYFRRGDLALAEKFLAAAAAQLPENSEIQDHLGDVFAGLGRLADAVTAWTRALDGDGEDVERAAIEQKLTDARSRLQDAR